MTDPGAWEWSQHNVHTFGPAGPVVGSDKGIWEGQTEELDGLYLRDGRFLLRNIVMMTRMFRGDYICSGCITRVTWLGEKLEGSPSCRI